MNTFTKAVLGFLFPRRCAVCGKITKNENEVCCPTCFERLPFDKVQRAAPVNFLSSFYSPLLYMGAARDAVLRYKFSAHKESSRFLAGLMAQCVNSHCKRHIDAVTWIPVSSKRLKQRGFDQARLLAKHMADIMGLDLICTLAKKEDNLPQSKMTGTKARAANVKGVYSAIDSGNFSGKTLLLVDDILTTGATMSEAARTLLKAGAEDIIGVCAARTR